MSQSKIPISNSACALNTQIFEEGVFYPNKTLLKNELFRNVIDFMFLHKMKLRFETALVMCHFGEGTHKSASRKKKKKKDFVD